MRVLIIGEGPHDVGVRDQWCDREKRLIDYPGWLQVFIRKLAKPNVDVEITAIQSREIVLAPKFRQKYRPLPSGHGEKALAAKFKGKTENYDVVIFMADTDSKDNGDWDKHHAWISEGFSKLTGGPHCVVCLPKCASESWLLADSKAWIELGLAETSELPAYPEDCWGKRNDPEGGHPHAKFAKICQNAGVSDSRVTRVSVAELSNMKTIHEKCPKSFGPFWAEFSAAGGANPP